MGFIIRARARARARGRARARARARAEARARVTVITAKQGLPGLARVFMSMRLQEVVGEG